MGQEFYGMQTTPNHGRELYKNFKGERYARYPVKTRLALTTDSLDAFIEEYALPFYKKGDIFCISTKVVSVMKGYYRREEDIKVTHFARFLVKFVKKWPDDPGFALPQKIQMAIDTVGMPRFILAMIIGGIMKLLGRPGWFYRIAGHNINAIDGFVPEFYPEPLRNMGFYAPPDSDKISDEIEGKYGMVTALLDGNNVENTILGMSKTLKAMFSKKDLMEVLDGNPQGQDDGTPILIVRKV